MLELREELGAALANRYVIERELGRGGMAIVYLARDLRHERRVAIKVLRPELSNSLGSERFLREITIASRLTHPNILALHDSGDVDGMLYHVMPYVEGESLRQRLDRERQLPIDEAQAIARQIAAALDYAHGQGVVHRDIKPENILLIGDHALVADFGLARAVTSAATPRLTESGIAVGTPAYISPEQASAEKVVDGRTDVYSLGCVVFEMIAGVAPFRGATAQAIIAHHVATPAPSLCGERASCPPGVDAAVRRALSKAPADRFRTAGEFVRALDDASHGGHARVASNVAVRQRAWRRPLIVGAVAALVLAASAGVVLRLARGRTPAPDTSRVVALPLTTSGGVATTDQLTSDATQRLRDALGEWSDLHVVDDRAIREALDAAGHGSLRTEQAMAVARRLGAGRLVWADLARTRDSVTIRASLYDVARGAVAKEARVSYPVSANILNQPYRELVNALLRDRDELPWTRPGDAWPASLAAWTAYDSARHALDSWDLTTAEQRLRDALRIQPEFPQAELWLAQVLEWKTWLPRPEEGLRAAEEERTLTARALSADDHLTQPDRILAKGLEAMAEKQYPQACAQFNELTKLIPDQFRAWFGVGDCLNQDVAVVADRSSPSGYAFRASWHSAAGAYERAVETLVGPPPAFLYRRLDRVLATEQGYYRSGRLTTDSSIFVAAPVLLSDTLAYVPYPVRAASTGFVQQSHVNRAIQANVNRLGRDLRVWVRLSPRDPVAHAMLGKMLEKAGVIVTSAEDSLSAMAQLRAARALTTDTLDRLGFSTDLVRLAVKADSFAAAARLADSILSSIAKPTSQQAVSLVGIATLLGDRQRATELLRPLMEFPKFGPVRPDGRPIAAPPAVLDLAAGATIRASLGICDDSLRDFSSELDRLMTSYVADSAQRELLRSAISRPILSAAVPCLGPAAVLGLKSTDLLVQQQQRLARGGRRAFRALFDSVQVLRRGWRPGDIAIDYTYQESWLLVTVGDTAAAVKHLDETLDALPTLGTQILDFPNRAAALVRAMALRASLAARRHEQDKSTKWATAVMALWSRADPTIHR